MATLTAPEDSEAQDVQSPDYVPDPEKDLAAAGKYDDPRSEYDPQKTPMGDSSVPGGATFDSPSQSNGSSEPSGGLYNPKEKTGAFKSALKANGLNRKRLLLGGGGIAGALTILVLIFLMLIPLKIEHIVTNLQNRFFSSSNNAVQNETQQMLSNYVKSYVLPALKKCSGSTIDKNCNVHLSSSTNPVSALYKGWADAKLEYKLANDYKIEFIYDKGKNRYYMRAPAFSKDQDISTLVDKKNTRTFNGNLFTQVSRGEARQLVNHALENETKWKQVMYRFKVGRLMEQKYGIRRCLIFCGTTDTIQEFKDKKVNVAKLFIAQRIINTRAQGLGVVWACILAPDCHPEDTSTTPSDGSNGELAGAPENAQTDTALRKKFTELAATYGISSATDIDKMIQNYKNYSDGGYRKVIIAYILKTAGLSDLTDKVTSFSDPTFISWITRAASIINFLKDIGPKIKKLGYIVNTAASAQTFNLFLTYADEIHTGHVSADQVGQMTQSLSPGNFGASTDPEVGGTAGAENTPLYNQLISGGTTTSTTGSLVGNILPAKALAASNSISNSPGANSYLCNNGKPVPSNQSVCSEEKPGVGNSTLNSISNSFKVPPLSFIGEAADLWTSINSAVNPISYLQSLFASALMNLPGFSTLFNSVGSFVSSVVGPFTNNVINQVIPDPFSTNMSGGRTFDMIAQGADVSGNDYAHTGLGGRVVTSQTATAMYNQQQKDDFSNFQHQSFFARMFSTDSQYSLVSRVAMDIPIGFQSSAENAFASLLGNPLSAITNVFGSALTLKTSAAAATPTTDAFDITQYGYTQADLDAIGDPGAYWDAHCVDDPSQGYQQGNTWNVDASQAKNIDQNGMPSNSAPNPCLLIKSTVGSAGGAFDSSLLTQDDLADITGSAGSTGGGTTNGSCSGGGKYSAIVGAGSSFAGVDQGIDFVPSRSSGFDICAPASGTITQADQTGHVYARTSGQAEVILHLDQAPNAPNSSQYIYFAEIIQIDSSIKVGVHVNKGDLIGHNNASPGIELGWAPNASYGFMCPYTGSAQTACGKSFDTWVQAQ